MISRISSSQVLKGCYFRHGDIMTAGIGNNPSFIWRSLVWSREILENGLLWRVGNGKSIKIFEDNWVPGVTSKIGIPNGSCQRDATVDSLINNGVWDHTLIKNNFNPFIVEEIINIPLSTKYTRNTSFGGLIRKVTTQREMVIVYKEDSSYHRLTSQSIQCKNGGLLFGASPYRRRYVFFCGEYHMISYLQTRICLTIMCRSVGIVHSVI